MESQCQRASNGSARRLLVGLRRRVGLERAGSVAGVWASGVRGTGAEVSGGATRERSRWRAGPGCSGVPSERPSASALGAGRWALAVSGTGARTRKRAAGWLAPPGGVGVAATLSDGKRGGT